jgi:hypothetical protein
MRANDNTPAAEKEVRSIDTDERLEAVERITIPFGVFKKALRRNYLGEPRRHDRSYVLRLYPEYTAEMEVEYYESEQGRHYDSNWSAKPFHIPPELIILESPGDGLRSVVNWPTEASVRSALSDEEISEEGGIDESVRIAREIFWDELKFILPDTFDLARVHGFGSYPVELNWTGLDDAEEEL